MVFKILAFTDLHASRTALEKVAEQITKHKPDLLICPGDISIFENGLEYTLRKINDLHVPCLLIHGNHEDEVLTQQVCKNLKYLTFLHKKTVVLQNILFIGHGGGGFSFEDPEFEEWAKTITPQIAQHNQIILIIHQPVYNTTTDLIYGGAHVGNKTYRRFIQKYARKIKLVFTGHIHECFGAVDDLSGVVISNPGQHGKLYLIE
ncbi:MAG: metallophosphoesterase [Nanoarchaeota archaeon]